MSNLNMPVKYCTDENDEEFSPVVYQESMFNDDGTRMDPVPRKMFAKAYDPTKTYPTENLFCIQDNKYYRFTGSGTTTGTFDPTKWTETDDATELTTLNSTLSQKSTIVIAKVQLGTTQSLTTGNIDITFNASLNGYTALGVIGYNLNDRTLASYINLSGIVLDNNDRVHLYGATTSNVTVQSTASVNVLYRKNN